MKSFLKTLLAAFVGALAAIAVSFVILLGMASVLISIGQKSETSSFTGEAILKLDLSKPITERSNNDPFSSISLTSFRMAEESTGILTAVTAIENAAADPRIKFIYINASGVALGMTALEEVRSALVKFRDSGKPIVAYADNFSQGGYYIASVADKIYMNRDGQAMMTGIGMNLMFFKDLLDKLGVEVQLIRHGKFKAAAEQFVSNNISEANREQNQAMMDAIWDSWASEICGSRELETDDFNSLIDNLSLGNAESMKKYNLIDEAVTEQEMIEALCTLSSVEDEDELEFITLAKYAKAAVKQNLKAKNKIAVIYAAGEISMNAPEGLAARKICPVIKKGCRRLLCKSRSIEGELAGRRCDGRRTYKSGTAESQTEQTGHSKFRRLCGKRRILDLGLLGLHLHGQDHTYGFNRGIQHGHELRKIIRQAFEYKFGIIENP